MKTSAAVASTVAMPAAVKPAHRTADFVTLTKPRLNFLVLITTLAGMYIAAPAGVPLALLVHALVGTALVAGGAAALNQAWEHQTDSLMRRTRLRPIPGGRLRVADGTWFGTLLTSATRSGLFVLKPGTSSVVSPTSGSSSSRGSGMMADNPTNRSVTVSLNPSRIPSSGALNSAKLV